jgi:hypothetical protein
MSTWAYNEKPGTPNFGPTIVWAFVGLASASLIFVALRVYVRLRVVKSFGWDDGTIVVTLVSLITSDAKLHEANANDTHS